MKARKEARLLAYRNHARVAEHDEYLKMHGMVGWSFLTYLCSYWLVQVTFDIQLYTNGIDGPF